MTFWHMPLRQKKRLIIDFFLCGLARASVKLLPFRWISRFFGEPCQMLTASILITPTQIRQALVIGRSIRLAARFTPWNSNCLAQAMVAKCWCRYHKIPYLFFIGFSKSQEKSSGYDGHAWVTAGPVAITGGHGFNTYRVVLTYASQRLNT